MVDLGQQLFLIAEAWLGPGYQVTSQVNVVNPGGRAQVAHRDYHLGFMSEEQSQAFPAHVHRLSPVLTLQGAVAHCDMPVMTGPTMYLPHSQKYLPGYLAMPEAGQETLSDYLDTIMSNNQKGFWRNADAYMISLLKEYWGEHATAENDYCFDYLPRINGDHGTYRTVMDMVDGGKVFGYFLLGQNPAVGSAHGRLQRLGMANLDWLVVRDLVEIESATFWKNAPEIETGEMATDTCRTEVFLFPAASHVEKAGTFTQTQRMLQWREKAVEPPGEARSELWFFYHLGRILREKLADSTDERDRPRLVLAWDYAMEDDEPSGEDVLRRINGVDLTTGRAVDNYLSLKADGSTACGCWIYSGVNADEVN